MGDRAPIQSAILNIETAKWQCRDASDLAACEHLEDATELIGAAIEQLKSAREKIRGEMRKEPANA